MKKRIYSFILTLALVGSLFAGCGNKENDSEKDVDEKVTKSEDEKAADDDTETPDGGLDPETPITLTLYGPGDLWNSEEDTMDAITGVTQPGYHVIIERWNELHPNVTLNIEGIGWTDWRAAITTAVSGGGVDLILHGGLLPDLVDDLSPYLEQDAEFADTIYGVNAYHTDDIDNSTLDVTSITSVPVTLNPGTLVIDKQIFDDYGVEVPSGDYTWEDILALAEQLTGTDPVTGEQTYGFLMRGTNGTSLIKSYSVLAEAYDAKVIEYAATEKDSNVDFTNEKTVEVFELMQNFAQYCSPDNVEGVQGEINLDETNNTAIGWYESTASGMISTRTQELDDRFIFLPLPEITEGEYAGIVSPYLGDNNIAICKYSENKEWAWEFIKFLLTDDVCGQFIAQKGCVGNNEYAVGQLADYIGEEYVEMIQNILAELPDGFNSTTNDYYDGINFGTMASYLSSHLAELVKGNVTPKECAENIQNEVDQVFATLE